MFPKCTVDHDIRRCRFDGKYSINIFPDQTRCEISRYDVTEYIFAGHQLMRTVVFYGNVFNGL